jgi:ribonuclease Z
MSHRSRTSNSVKVHALGTGSAQPSALRQNSSYLVNEPAGSLLLIDCSGSPLRELLALGYQVAQLRTVVLTHAHVDHIYALPSVVHGIWMSTRPNQSQLEIAGSPETLRVARGLLDLFGLPQKENATQIHYRECAPDSDSIVLSGFGAHRLVTFPVDHAGMQALGVLLAGDPSIIFTGDTVFSPELARRIGESAAVVIADCGGGTRGNQDHAGLRDWLSLIDSSDRPVVYLSHVPPGHDLDAGSLWRNETLGQARIRLLSDGDKILLRPHDV